MGCGVEKRCAMTSVLYCAAKQAWKQGDPPDDNYNQPSRRGDANQKWRHDRHRRKQADFGCVLKAQSHLTGALDQ